MSKRHSGYQRQRDDVNETPFWVTRVVLPYLQQHCLHVWDPANGPASKIAQVLSGEGFDVIATSDDFLARTSLPHANIDSICTDPPYGRDGGRLACRFIEHALELVPVVVMLLRIDFDSGKTRTYLFLDCGSFAHKIVLLDRIVWFEREGADPSGNHAWYIWNSKHNGSPSIEYAGGERT
jgi:hypothetical protein